MKHRTLFNFISLNTSSFINKVLNFFLFIFLVRLLSPQQYGIYNIVWAQIGLLGPFVDFGTTNYGLIHSPQEDKKRFVDLISFRLYLSLFIIVITFILGYLFHFSVEILTYILLTSVVIIANMWSGSFLILMSLLNKTYLPSVISVIFNILTITTFIILLLLFKSLLPLFVAVFVFYSLYALMNWYIIRRRIGAFDLTIDVARWKNIISKSYVFVLISFFAGLYFKIDILLLKLLRSEYDVALYSAGYKFFEALIFIASSYNFAAVPVLSRLYKDDKEKFVSRLYRDSLVMGIIGLGGVIGVYLFSPYFLPLVLKGNYNESIKVLKIVIFALPFLFASTVLLNTVYIMGKSIWVVYLFCFLTVFNIINNYWLIPQYSYTASAWITVGSEVMNTVILSYFVYQLLRKND